MSCSQSLKHFEINSCSISCFVPVAQLDRASDYGSEGRGFESSRAYNMAHDVPDMDYVLAAYPTRLITREEPRHFLYRHQIKIARDCVLETGCGHTKVQCFLFVFVIGQ